MRVSRRRPDTFRTSYADTESARWNVFLQLEYDKEKQPEEADQKWTLVHMLRMLCKAVASSDGPRV